MEKMVRLKSVAIKYLENYNKEKTVEYINKYCKEEADELLRQADMLLEQTFIFQDKWDMEPCNIPYKITLDTWVESPNGDEEWVFMLNRHEFLWKLWSKDRNHCSSSILPARYAILQRMTGRNPNGYPLQTLKIRPL